jgi:hypothetical protein
VANVPIQTLEFNQMRQLAGNAAQDNFFRGLVSTRLGSDRILDDELVDLIVGNQLLAEIFDDLCRTPAGKAKIERALAESFPEPNGFGKPEYNVAGCRMIWIHTVADPRFDIVLKQSLDDVKVPPLVIRGSSLSKVMGVLDKIRAALTSGTIKHTDGALAASILASILAGGFGVHYIQKNLDNSNPPTSITDSVTPALNGIAEALQTQNRKQQELGEKIVAVINKQELDLRDLHGALLHLPRNRNEQIDDVNQSITNLITNLQNVNENLNSSNGSVKLLLQQEVKQAGLIQNALQQIAEGIGLPATSKDSRDLLSLRASSQQIARNLDPADATLGGSAKSLQATTSSQRSLAAPSPSRGATIAESLKAMQDDSAMFLKTMANDTAAIKTTYLSNQPVVFLGQYAISRTLSSVTINRIDGTSCQVTWILVSASTKDANISMESNTCGISLPKKTTMVLDHTPKRLPGTNLELTFERPDQTRIWSFWPKAAIVAVYQNPLLDRPTP